MYFDDVFEYTGGAGVYQSCLLLYQVAISILGLDAQTMNFLGGTMEHWCQVPALQNFTHDQQKYIAIPDDDSDYEQCYRFPLNFSSFTEEELLSWNRTEKTGDIPRSEWVKCDMGWVYDKSEWVSTVNSRVSAFDSIHTQLMFL